MFRSVLTNTFDHDLNNNQNHLINQKLDPYQQPQFSYSDSPIFKKQINIHEDQKQEQLLIRKQIDKITQSNFNTNHFPYLISSFNTLFDQILNKLVIEYEFDFDRIALHLHYLFPVYEQKITSRTVALRWWQLQTQAKLNINHNYNKNHQEKGSEHNINNMNEKQINKNNQDKQQRTQTQTNHSQCHQYKWMERDRKQYTDINQRENLSKKYKSNFYNYNKALEQSMILEQEQSQRPILYKPKFIVDSEYKLERYETFDNEKKQQQKEQWAFSQDQEAILFGQGGNQQNIVSIQDAYGNMNEGRNYERLVNYHNIRQHKRGNISHSVPSVQSSDIRGILSRVVTNDFLYDQFGTFDSFNLESESNNVEFQKDRPWWEEELSVGSDSESSSQQQASSQQLISKNKEKDFIQLKYNEEQQQNQQKNLDKQKISHQDHKQQEQQGSEMIKNWISSKQGEMKNCIQIKVNNKEREEIESDWDEYESD